jgi:hypothetical protein
MSFKISRNKDGNCINFTGSSNPTYWNACLSGEVDSIQTDLVNVINDVRSNNQQGETVYEFYNIPYTEFLDASGDSFESAQSAADYITVNGNVSGPEDINAGYKGVYNAETNVPATGNSGENGDWYWVTTSGNGLSVNDQIRYNSTTSTWDTIADVNVQVNDIENGNLSNYDLFCKASYSGFEQNGSTIRPYKTIQAAVNAASDGDRILMQGDFVITSPVSIPSGKSLYFYGDEGTKIRYSAYSNGSTDNLFTAESSTGKELAFNKIQLMNAGGYAISASGATRLEVKDCIFHNNGWSGSRLDFVNQETDVWASGGTLGYNSTSGDLASFYASECSEGGAIKVSGIAKLELTDLEIHHGNIGIKAIDCGFIGEVEAFGYIARSQIYSNVGVGISLDSSESDGSAGCRNFTVYNNAVHYNGANGIKTLGGMDNTISLGTIKGNWSAGLSIDSASNYRIRELDLSDNNRSSVDANGIESDGLASLQVQGSHLDSEASMIVEILNVQIHKTHLGAGTVRCGILLKDSLENHTSNNAIINIDDVGFLDQDYALDFACDLDQKLSVSVGDCRYTNSAIKNVRVQGAGGYSEQPFSNHVTSVVSVDIVVDTLKRTVALNEGVGGSTINVYNVNELQSVERSTTVDIIQKNTDKIQLKGLTYGSVYINGELAGSDLSSMNNSINAAFNLTLTQYKDFLVSEVGINAGDTLPSQANNWYIAYGASSGEQITSAGIIADIKDKQPFYNGDFLEKGHEYIWTHDDNGSYMVGTWSGAESATPETSVLDSLNWGVGFRFVRSSNRISGSASVGIDLETRWNDGDLPQITADGQYDVTNSTVLALRYGNDNYLYLLDITGGDEVIIGRSNTTLVGDSQTVFFAGENQPNAKFPVMQERTDRWTIVHDYDNSENGEWSDGIESRTIIKSNMYIDPGEKFTFMLPGAGLNKYYGLSYYGAATGVANPISGLQDGVWRWDAQEIIHNMVGWTMHSGAAGYGRNTNHPNKWGVIDGQPHTVSYRHKSDETMEMWSEEDNDLIMTYSVSTDGLPMHLFYGSVQYGTSLAALPILNKYDLDATSDGTNVSTWYYIESPDGVFTYPLFATTSDANAIDASEGGSGNSNGYSYGDDPTGNTWYGPVTNIMTSGTSAPSHGVWGNSTNVIWNEIATDEDSSYAPPAFSDTTITLNEGDALNTQIHPVDATFITTIANAPSWITQAGDNQNVTGSGPTIRGDNTNYPSVTYTVDVVRTYANYGSSVGILTVVVENTTPAQSLPGTLHAGSVTSTGATNSAGLIYFGPVGEYGKLVYDIPTALADGDKIEWYHQDGTYGYGIVASGVDKATTDLLVYNSDNSSSWDLLAPLTGHDTFTNGQNFGNDYSVIWDGLVPLGWDDNTNPQVVPTRPIYSSSDVWKLFNNAGTIELHLNGVLFRSSSSTHTDPIITFAVPNHEGHSSDTAKGQMPNFTHTANTADAPTGFTLEEGEMDTSLLLNGDSVVSFDNLTVAPGQRLVVTKSWANTNILPYIDGDGGEDNKVFIGIAKTPVSWGSVDLSDFFAVHRYENQTSNLTKLTQYNAGPSPVSSDVNRSSDSDIHFNVAIDYSRDGNLSLMRSSDSDPSLVTEVMGGTFSHSQTWASASGITGASGLPVALGTKNPNTRVKVTEVGVSVVTSPLPTNQYDVTESTGNYPLFNGVSGESVTLNAGQIHKFWMHSDSIEETDSLGFCLISDNSAYASGVTTSGTSGQFGSLVQFDVPSGVPPIKFKWNSDGVDYYSTPSIAGSTYSSSSSGITLLGPSSNISGQEFTDDAYLEVDETIAAGQRFVMSNDFLEDLMTEMVSGGAGNQIHIAVKGSGYSDTSSIHGSSYGGMWMRLRNHGGTNQISLFDGSSSIATQNITTPFTDVSAFIEITGSGNNIRFGVHDGPSAVAATTTYVDWWSNKKMQTGDQGYGITDEKIVFRFVHSSGTFDTGGVDWTELSEISIPVNNTIDTSWTKAIDFSGSSENAKQVTSSDAHSPIRMGGSTSAISNHSNYSTKTSDSSTAKPWATAIVFKTDNNVSNQHIWNQGEGASTNNDNIFLRVNSSGELIFGWKREGSGANECQIHSGLSSSTWYGVYILHKGQRFSASGATSAHLPKAFDIRVMSSADSFNAIGSNVALTGSNWISTGQRMDRGVSGDFTIGGRGSNRNFHGKIASMVVTTLRVDVAVPTDAEIKLMITDPMKWRDDYKVGEIYRDPNFTNDSIPSFQLNTVASAEATQIWLMGDGTSDSYSNMIRNQVYPADQNYTKMNMINMVAGDIETVSITGLT